MASIYRTMHLLLEINIVQQLILVTEWHDMN